METPALNRLLDLVSQTKTYQEVLKDYKNIYTEQIDFQKEAAGKILGKFIVGTYTNEVAEEDYGAGLMGTLRKLWNAIKRFFSGNQNAVNDLHAQLTEILGPAASDMIEGVNPGGLNIDNIGINKYYALEKNKVEFRNAKGEVISPTKRAKGLLRRANRYASSKVPYLRNFTQRDAMDQLLGESEAINAPTSKNDFYTYDGVQLNRVSKLMEIFQDPFNQREMAIKVAQINSKEGNSFDTADKVQTLWDFLRDDMGTGIHNLMQGIVERKDLNSLLDSLPEEHRESYRQAIPELRTWVREKENKGSTLYSEVRIADKSDLLAGTVDIIEVTSDGKKILHDFKTKMAGKFGNIEKKFPAFKGPLASVTNNLLNKYRLQLSLYKYIIEEKGIVVDELNVVPLEADVSINNEGKITFNKVRLAKSQSPIISKLSNLEPIKKKVIKSAVSYISPDQDIKNIQKDKESSTLERLFEKAKKQVKLKIEDYVRSGTAQSDYAQKINQLLVELDELDEKEGLILYTKRAVRDINAAHRRLKELIQANAVTAEALIQIQSFVHAYDNLDEITAMAPILAEHGYENLIKEYVTEAIAKKNLVDELVKAQSRPIIAQTLGELSGNPNVTIESLERQLLIADRDITFLARHLDALGDSKDTTLAMIDRMVTLQLGKVNRAEHDLMHGTKDRLSLLTLIEELDKYQEAQGVNMFNNREVYNFMLETTEDGKYTGYIVTEMMPEWYEARDKFIADKLNEGIALTDIVWREFFEKFDPKKYQSQKYKNVMNLHDDNILKKFYSFFMENYEYANSILPANYRRIKERVALPSLRATSAAKFLEQQGSSVGRAKAAVKELISDAFGRHEDNIQWGEYVDHQGNPLDYVPIHYARKIGNEEGQLSPEDVSYDLANSLKMFYTMATNFSEMNEVIPHLELAKLLVKTRRVTKLDAGVPILDQLGDEVTTAGIDSRAYARLFDYFNMQVYGKRKKHEGSVTILGKEVRAEQIGDAMLQLGSLRVLALNPHASLANVTFGHLMTFIEAVAGDTFGVKNWAKAGSIYAGGLTAERMGNPGLLTDFLGRGPKSKIGLINSLFNVNQEFNEYGTRLSHRKLGLRANQSALYFGMTMGEHTIQTQMAIAAMLNTKFTTSKGEVNLWDSYKVVDNRLELDSEVASQFSEKDRILLAERIQALYQRIHGIYNTKDRAAIQQWAAGRWALQFRKWMRPGMLRRFEGGEKLFYSKDSKFKGPEWNERLESYVEGNYVTAAKFLNTMIQEMRGLEFMTLNEKYQELEPWQQANLRRALGEGAGLLLLMVLGSAVGFGYDEDDPNAASEMSAFDWQMLYNVKRVQAELMFFNPLGSSFFEILRSPAANMTTIEAYSKLISQFLNDMTSVLFGGDIDRYKRKTGPYEKGDAKILKRFRNTLPFKELFTDPKDKIKFFDLKS
jgi:cellobiose-specific phosphotransferase system component IIA